MKRVVSFIITFLLIIFIYQIVVVFLSNSHSVSYQIASDDKIFTINETFKKDSNENGYYINIIDDTNKEFIFYVENYYNKQKKIINEIKYYEKDNYLCLYPIDIKNKNDFEILCNDGTGIYSYYYTNTKTDISLFLKNLNLTDKYIDNKNEEVSLDNTIFYKKNIYGNEYVELYRYKSLYIYNNGEVKDITFSNNDIYKNNLGAYINQYFLVPVLSNNTIIGYNVIDCLTKEQKTIEFTDTVSTNSYVVGIASDELYLFDITNKLEIAINPEGSYQIIGNVEKGFTLYQKGNWIDVSITEFTTNKVTFDLSHDVDLKYEYSALYAFNNAYYIIDNNKLYKIYKNDLETRVLLLELNNYNNLKIINDRIYYTSNQYLYRYNQYGVKTLLSSNELKYNDTNIYNVYND